VRSLTFLFVLMLVGISCAHHHSFDNSAVQRSPAASSIQPAAKPMTDATVLAAQQLWENRRLQASAKDSIEAWRRVTVEQPQNAEAFLRLAQASHFFATSFKSDESTMRALYVAAIVASERGLRIVSPAFEAARRNGDSVMDSMHTLGAREAPFLYWHAITLGGWAAIGGLMDQMREMPNVRKMMHWVDQQAPLFDDGGAARWLGAYYAAAPSIAGGDMKESRRFFERAIMLAPNRLDNRFHFAELYARRANDKALWQAQLEFAVTAKSTDTAEDHLAKIESTRLLARGFQAF
jgi:tetratricopeptide (TPR) repeat protein